MIREDNGTRRAAGLPVIRVRIGLHTGEVEERDGDYFGPSVNRAARLMATAHGGQVVVSEVTAALCRDRLPDGVEAPLDEGQLRLLVKVLAQEPGLNPVWNWHRNGVQAHQD